MKPLYWLHLSLILLPAILWAARPAGAEPLGDESKQYLPLIIRTMPTRAAIPSGPFWMGCNSAFDTCTLDEQPLHSVFLSAYAIDIYEVTNRAYQRCVTAGACTSPHLLASDTRDPYYTNPLYAGYPVIGVDWRQASAYCTWKGGRLPSEAQWEKAARGASDTRTYPWGETAPDCTRLNFFTGTNYCVADTSPVGSYLAGASPYGVVDLSGNVWEWVADWYQDDYYDSSPSTDPLGPASGLYKVLRGGSYYSDREFIRNAVRLAEDPASWYPNAGFRCAYE